MEGRVDIPLETGRPWQADLCQFFTRENVAELCLAHVTFPRNLLSMRLLEPAAAQGAFFLPLLSRLVRACRRQKKSFDVLRPIIRAYEIDGRVADTLRLQTEITLEALGVDRPSARHIAREWIRNADFLEARPRTRFTHIVGNPPYIRWDAIPGSLRDSYKTRFASFKRRADLYVAFIERALALLGQNGQLGFLCPGTWTRNVYGGAVREAFTTRGQLKTIIDFSDAESFETSADAYPHFFVFQKGAKGPTRIRSMAGSDKIQLSGKTIVRKFRPSAAPLFLSRDLAATKTVKAARKRFPKIEDADASSGSVRQPDATVFFWDRDGKFLSNRHACCPSSTRIPSKKGKCVGPARTLSTCSTPMVKSFRSRDSRVWQPTCDGIRRSCAPAPKRVKGPHWVVQVEC